MAERITRSKGTSTNNNPDSDVQRAKKRAWDRAAQRKRREKTKTQLDHMEQTIRILKTGDQANKVTELMAEIETLRAENQRLRNVMASSAKLLQAAQLDLGSRDDGVGGGDGEVGSPNTQDQTVPSTVASQDHGTVMAVEPAACGTPGNEIEGPVIATPHPSLPSDEIFPPLTDSDGLATTTNESLLLGDDFFAAFELAVVRSPSLCDTPGTRVVQDTGSFGASSTVPFLLTAGAVAGPDETYTRSCSGTPDAMSSCAAWQMATRIFDTIYHVDVFDALAADSVDAGLLLKGIDLGWHVCAKAIERSPTIHILSQMDKCLWSSLPKSSRAAIAYKSYMLLCYLLNPSPGNLLRMPDWERPTALQQTTDHPVAIGFFPWPSLRDRLILNQEYYLNTCNFFVRLVSEFEFRWQHSYEQTFVLDRRTGEYRATPLFVQHVRDLKNWTMKESFFDSFPEFESAVCLHDRT